MAEIKSELISRVDVYTGVRIPLKIRPAFAVYCYPEIPDFQENGPEYRHTEENTGISSIKYSYTVRNPSGYMIVDFDLWSGRRRSGAWPPYFNPKMVSF